MATKKQAWILGFLLVASALFYGGSLVLSPWLFDDTDELLTALQIEKGDWVADVGSGKGDYTLPIAEAVGDSGRVYAVDIDKEVLETVGEKAKSQGYDNIRTVLGEQGNPKLPHDSFDAVLIRKAYHEFAAPMQMLRKIRRALKPEGRLVMLEDIKKGLVEASRSDQVQNHDLSIRYARKELRKTGYKIEREVDTLRYLRFYDVRYWMLVASPSAK